MAEMADNSSKTTMLGFSPSSLNGTTTTSDAGSDDSGSQQDPIEGHGIKFEEWGFKVDRLFEVAYRFYKRNESKAFHPSYNIRNQMNALILQAKYGNFDGGRAPDIGTLDLVGKNRRYQWSLLKGMSKTEAMYKFICTLDDICPFFKAYAEAVRISSNAHQEFKSKDSWSERDEFSGQLSQSESEGQLKAIHTSLNRQTYNQFKGYAEKQYPNDPSKQKYLISTLQEQYYQQYIAQMRPESSKHDSDNVSIRTSGSGGAGNSSTSSNGNPMVSPTSSESSNFPPADNPVVDTEVNHVIRDDNNAATPSNELLSCQQLSQGLPLYQNPQPALLSSYHQEPQMQQLSFYQEHPQQQQQMPSYQMVPSQEPQSIYQQANPLQELPPLYNSQQLLRGLPSYPFSQPLQEATNNQPIDVERISSPALSCAPAQHHDGHVEHQQRHPKQEQVAGVSTQPIDTWSCGSSSGDASPLQPSSITYEPLEPATVWTKKGVNEFKDSLADDSQGGAYVVKQGTLLTIQVPTYPGGKYIYWEFATEDYDIGFGLDFIYEANLAKPLTLKIYEDEDEDDDEDFEESSLMGENYDLESAAQAYKMNGANQREELMRRRAEKFARTANTISIVPTYRRDSHEEVFVGRHRYPGQGYYLLKFDNTYSVLRAKSLYFRICYFI